jgi:hypothetical protein
MGQLQSPSHGFGHAAEAFDDLVELGGQKRLMPVGQGRGGVGMTFNDDPIGARRDGGFGHGNNVIPHADAVGGIHQNGQMRQRLSRTGTAFKSRVNRVAVSKVRMPRSHSITFSLPLAMMYSAAISHSSMVVAIPRLNMAGLRVRPTSRREIVILGVPGADLQDVRVAFHQIHLTGIHHFGDNGHAGGAPRFRQKFQRFFAQPLKRVGRRARLEGAAAENLDPAFLISLAVAIRFSRVSTEQGPAMMTICSPPILTPLTIDDRVGFLNTRLTTL